MSDTIAAPREPALRTAENAGPATTTMSPGSKPDPMRDLLEKFDKVAALVGSQNPGMAAGLRKLVQQSATEGSTEQPMFRTQVAYMLQDVEKMTGAKSLGVPSELRSELTRLAATSPGLENERMKALVQSTPDVADRGVIRDIRRSAAGIAGMGDDQYSKAAQEMVEVLETRLRLATRFEPRQETAPEPDKGGSKITQNRPNATLPGSSVATQSTTDRATPTQSVRTAASPGDTQASAGGKPTAKDQDDLSPNSRPNNVMTNLMRGLRSPSNPPNDGPRNPWEPAPVAMKARVTAFEERLADGRTDQHIRAAEASGEKLMQSIERFSAGPGAGVLGKIEAAANSEPGGMQAVMTEMQPGGRYATLRSEFDSALQKDRVFSASFSAIEKAALQYGQDRLTVNADYQARGLNPAKLDDRFLEAEAAIGRAAEKIPGRVPGQNIMAEMAEKVSQVLSRAVERVRTMFAKNPEAGPRQNSGPKP